MYGTGDLNPEQEGVQARVDSLYNTHNMLPRVEPAALRQLGIWTLLLSP